MSGATRRDGRLMGYADRWSVAPGEAIAFHVSADCPQYEAEIVQVLRGGPRTGEDPDAFAFERVGTPVDGSWPGGVQDPRPGSYVLVPGDARLPAGDGLTAQTWVCPTTPGDGRVQGLLARCAADGTSGWGLVLDGAGALACRVGATLLSTGVPLRAGDWYLVGCAIDPEAGVVRLVQRPLRRHAGDPDRAACERPLPADARLAPGADAPLLLGGERLAAARDARRPPLLGAFNGKLDGPCLLGRALTASEMARVREGEDARAVAPAALVADWDFSRDMALRHVSDVAGSGHHGATVNAPLRGVTGRAWSGRVLDHRLAPEEYGAIHFHDDDLDDAGWEPAFRWTLPEGLPSGAYAVRLTAGGSEDLVPFFVRPPRDRPTGARVAFLASTFTYMAYSNYAIDPVRARQMSGRDDVPLDEIDPLLSARGDLGRSLYQRHTDGSGVAHVSRLRPMLNQRPTYRWFLSGGGGWALSGDMYAIDWLGARGVAHDVITDEDLHEDGAALLARYDVVLTGAHPEYVTEEMLDALEHHVERGGRLMYLGGNGFYWVTTVLPDRPHVIELRRGLAGTRAWASGPGEEHHADGSPGGLWRDRGRAPQRLVGVGFTAQGGGPSAPYRRTPASEDPRAAFIFEGVEGDGPIGAFGSCGGGAAGAEIDRADTALGTPPHALVLATSQGGHGELVHRVVEEILALRPGLNGPDCPEVRADLTFFETPGGGAVFSTGSIDWSAALSHDDYDNDVARITDNVLRRFLDGPFGAPDAPRPA